jgi:hypothetical protein
MTITIIDNPCVTLWYHPDKKIVHHQVHKFVTGNDFRSFLIAGGECLKKNMARKWLSDDRANAVLGKADLEWSEVEWAPQVARFGWKHWAIVRPEKVLAGVAMERLVTKYAALGVSAKLFADPGQAMTWLERQP